MRLGGYSFTVAQSGSCMPLLVERQLANKGPLAHRRLKGGPASVPPRGYFDRNRRMWLETAQPTRQKAIQGLLSRFRRSPGPWIFDGFFANLNRALSALFFQKSAILAFLGEPPNEAILDLRDPQNRTRNHDSVPKGPNISSYGPFSSHLVRISSQIKLNPSRPTWGNLAMDFCFFFNWGTWILKVPKRPRKRHNWIAELASFKMR